jgi:ABC-type uncharacterized transport system ATPase subunit
LSNNNKNVDDIYLNEKGTYMFGFLSDSNEASKSTNFRRNATEILKAVRIKLGYIESEALVFFSYLCDTPEEEVKQKLEELL